MKKILFALSWTCLLVGIAGLSLGVAGDRNLTIPGAVLVGSAVIALALHRE